MCGLAGIFGFENTSVPIDNMVSALSHRGPDGSGVFQEGVIALGHTRLSILDLSDAGSQPMVSENGNLIMVFNGEVFNYQNLANQYLKGTELKSNSDSEVVLKLYELLGPTALNLFRGMFAILIWDREKSELFGARDRLGIKPFFYAKVNNAIVFGSEIKAILASGLVKKSIDKNSLFQLFQYGHIGQPSSIIDGVKAVPPASYFKIKLNQSIEFKTYWTFNSSTQFEGSFEEACESFRNEFEEAVSLRMISDRPIGVFLSSGLDSVSLLAALKSRKTENVQTFTIGFESKNKKFYREDFLAKEISQHFGYANESIIINEKEIIKDFPSFVFGLDQPSIDGFNSYLVSKYTSSHITVALSGLGGDEIFLGYPRNMYLNQRLRNGNQLFSSINEKYQMLIQMGRLKSNRYLQFGLNKCAGYNDFNFAFWIHHLLDTYSNVAAKFNFAMNQTAAEEMQNYLSHAIDSTTETGFNRIMAFEFRTYTINQLLRDMDAVSMFNKMEIRVPFLDHKFIEFCLSLPDPHKYNNRLNLQNFGTGTTTYASSGMKYILGKSYENLFPPEFLHTTKQGFQLPVYEWAEIYCQINGFDFLSSEILSEYFSDEYLKKKRDKFRIDGKFDTDLFLLFILVLWSDSML